MATIGVLALQGAFAAHASVLERIGHLAMPVRTAAELERLDGLVLPGGESTAQLHLIERFQLGAPLAAFWASGRPLLATCAGLILVARSVIPLQSSFGWLDVEVARNAWGRQIDSFEAQSDDGAHPLLFIRAPRIVAVGPGVEVLARYRGEPVMVRAGRLTATAFHPELTDDATVHRAAFGDPSTARRVAQL
jgi:5'-phosphate synthase pdxT subunit